MALRIVAAAVIASLAAEVSAAPPLAVKVALGKRLFNEVRLSDPDGQSCASCHAAEVGFTDPDQDVPTSEGVLAGRFGPRNTPTAAYASFAPPLHFDPERATYVGGLFWDGRADDLMLQAQAPFLNPLEMHNTERAQVVQGVIRAGLAPLFARVYGISILLPRNTDAAYVAISDAIAAFEASRELNRFTSKYDYFLKGLAQLTPQEALGLELFNGKANCFVCHPSTIQGEEPGPLFTDFSYHNIGVPKNFSSPFLSLPPELNPAGMDFIDEGLANTVAVFDPEGAAAERGKFKTSTLRNLELTSPYGHNGFFASVKEIVHFYNTRDTPDAQWAPPEIPETINVEDLGDLGLTNEEEDAVVAFLRTLTDGYRPFRP